MTSDPRFEFDRGLIVEVCWIDSSGEHGWHSAKEEIASSMRLKGMCIRTVGYMVHEDEHGLLLTSSLCATGNVLCTLTIPHFAIQSRRRFRSRPEPAAVESPTTDGLEVG